MSPALVSGLLHSTIECFFGHVYLVVSQQGTFFAVGTINKGGTIIRDKGTLLADHHHIFCLGSC